MIRRAFCKPSTAAFVVSLIAHILLLGFAADIRPANHHFQKGREAVRLTLLPSAPATQPYALDASVPADANSPDQPAETVGLPGASDEPVLSQHPEAPSLAAARDDAVSADRAQSDNHEIDRPESSEPFVKTPDAGYPEHASQDKHNGSLQEQGVDIPARLIAGHNPEYPWLSRRRGEEGSVTIEADISPDGRPSAIQIVSSSGFRRLDEAAISAMQKSVFAPAKLRGRPVLSTMRLAFTFRLEDMP